MRSGFEPSTYEWDSEYYEELRGLDASAFVQHTFVPKPALVGRRLQAGHQVTEEYRGQAYKPEEYELVPEGWEHDHCKVCRFRIEAGHTYWETTDRVWLLCDECHQHLSVRRSNERE